MLFLAVLPYVATFAFSNISTITKDLRIARISIMLMIIGTLVVAFSPTRIPMIIGAFPCCLYEQGLIHIGLTVYTLG